MLASIEEVRYQKLPATVRRLARIARYLTFWKTERLDVLARTDDAVRELYQDAANVLDISLNQLFAMRRSEIEEALEGGSTGTHRGTCPKTARFRSRSCRLFDRSLCSIDEPKQGGGPGPVSRLDPRGNWGLSRERHWSGPDHHNN